MDYKSSGVDIEAGNAFVSKIKSTVESTHRPEVVGGFGGFNGMIRIPEGYKKPVLVSGADGVGTKLSIAQIWDKHYEMGIDLVAMCVNDVITCGAKPLYFLDYIATGKLNFKSLSDIITGIAMGCTMSECTLLGGETAEMSIMYSDMEYDLAGFCTGVVEEDDIIDGSDIAKGDLIIGIESSGLHSNGYSLINDMLWRHKIAYLDMPELSTPTRIYASVVKELINEVPILGMAHITGGGIVENLPRCIPNALKPNVDYDSWPMPDIFKKIMFAGEIPPEEMKRVFNLGIGYCIVIPKEAEMNAHDTIGSFGYKSWTIGEVVL